MLRLFSTLLVITFLIGCKGEQGEIGPQGLQGATGARGATGATGPAGVNGLNGKDGRNGIDALAATYEDFTEDISVIGIYSPKTRIAPDEFIFLFINSDGIISPLPFRGYSYTSDKKDFVKLDCSYNYLTSSLYIENETVVPPGATFAFRLVRIKGVKAGKIKKDISWEELKEEYNL